jgi:predicted metal-dependent phosphoesterase TrpH
LRIDLHAHSNRSDGLLSPAMLVERAFACGVTHLALTDHDTIDGVPEARTAAAGRLELIGGIEFSVGWQREELHLLGLFLEPSHPAIVRFCARARDERERRIERMVEALGRAHVDVPLAAVLEAANGATPARPHLARVLVRMGFAADVSKAFDSFLAEGRPGHVPRWLPTVPEVVQLVREAGGVTSLAHPGVHRLSRNQLAELALAGIDAVEANHPDHPPTQVEAYERWGAPLGLLMTGGSDFHGDGGHSHGPPGTRTTTRANFDRLFERHLERTAGAST